MFNKYFQNVYMYSLIYKSMKANGIDFKKGFNHNNRDFISNENFSTGIIFHSGRTIYISHITYRILKYQMMQ
jgi:hypothetical protein